MKTPLFLIIPLLLYLMPFGTQAQVDCPDAIVVCGSTNYTGLTANGRGIQEIIGSVCGGQEHNSLWFKLPIKTGGTLGFILTPESTDIEIDFDFWIFGPDVTCSNLGFSIRCSATNPEAAGLTSNTTGMNSTETDTAEGPSWDGNSFVQWLTVQDNETYYLIVDRPHDQSDFSIQWTGTATFHDVPVFNAPPGLTTNIESCDFDGTDDQRAVFDLTVHEEELTGSQTDVAITYHTTLNDAVTNVMPVLNPAEYTNIANPQTIYMRMTNTQTGCFATENFEVEVTGVGQFFTAGEPEDLLLCDINGDGFAIFNLRDNDNALKNGNNVTVTYYASQSDAENETNPLNGNYTNTQPYGPQTIWARVQSSGNCLLHYIKSFTITVAPVPDITYSVQVTDFTVNDNSITILIDNPGNYLFSINGGPYGANHYFNTLTAGLYTVSVKDMNSCNTVSKDIVILNYPKFFTPNGDNVNEYWQVHYLFLRPSASIAIFDRFGKLLTGFNGSSPGWDGTYNGHPLPATDYWFTLELEDGRIIKGHFAMIR